MTQSAKMSDSGWYLREHRQAAGLTLQALADAVESSVGYISDLEKGRRRHNSDVAARLAAALGVEPVDLYRLPGVGRRIRMIPIVGYVGAGAEAHLFAEGQGPFGEVEAPDNATDATVAVEIRGESLGALFNEWLVFYDNVQSPVRPALHGKLCVVGLPDGRVLVKQIKPAGDGLFHLISNTEGPLFDQEILWAAKVMDMRPR